MEEIITMKELEIEHEQVAKGISTSPHSGFDATKNIRLVPKFEEKEVDKYSLHFEKNCQQFEMV